MALRLTSTGVLPLNSDGTIFDGSKKWCVQFAWTGTDIQCFAVSGIPGVTHASFDGAQADGSTSAYYDCTGWYFELGGSGMSARTYSGSPCIDSGGGANYQGNAVGLGPLRFTVTEAAGTYTVTAVIEIAGNDYTIFSASGAFGTITSGSASLALTC